MIYVEKRWEQSYSRGQTNSADEGYVVFGTNSREAAYTAVGLQTPDAIPVPEGGFLARTNIFCDQIGPNLWDARVTYGLPAATDRPERPEIGGGKRSFEIGFRNEKVIKAIGTRTYWRNGESSPPNFEGAIGVEKNQAKGVDVNTPVYTWSESIIISRAQFNSRDYFRQIWQVAKAPVNSVSFRDFDAGEVLFVGATGSERDSDSAEMVFRFSAAPNLSGLTIAQINNIVKRGWEYLEGFSEDAESGSTVIRKIRAIYVHQVYYTSNFAMLGI